MIDTGKIASWMLRQLDPELAHEIAIRSIGAGLAGKTTPDDPSLKTHVLGLSFPNPIGLAAGFDKNARAIRGLAHLGFGYVEAGTVTPRPQPGNPRPRLFRLLNDGAIINRMGFNSCGIDQFCQNLAHLYRPSHNGTIHTGSHPIGINLGINKINAHPLEDYPALIGRVKSYADYITINLSSPNTPGLRDLQSADMLSQILDAIQQKHSDRPPLLVKLSPDIDDESYEPIVEAAINHGANGLILTNTTLARPQTLSSPHRHEAGGLSGRPLTERSRHVLQHVSQISKGRLTLISSGGIESGYDILQRLQMGASLVQVYTSFIYEGPTVLTRLKHELLDAMSRENVKSLSEISAVSSAS
ncbi:quinone-dependent dihydroorotate dehydrogenase [Saccharibacter sp. 17.LH.SD]|uniref:quinone-dependent dihydroorotate dehydrogenase n=1 Tax=Saccharibacter sp. 17.LH.SD TaxID=2689393 RepID=UPI00137050AC|nr:quinone-dependent dihydroorotate dehydrogenase [Saccharibacter sp. 17.LH.SD]MXV43756.1 quinone-dependent dihydroorotate dehydrogenase [Saccharibacter sp. 17.LH.SD]